MESLGNYLKAQRESQSLSLQQVSESTKIREPLLKALEEDRYDLISSPVYVKGFLEAYARHLGLAPDDIIRQYQENVEERTPLKSLGPKGEKASSGWMRGITVSRRKIALWLLIAGIAVTIFLIGMVVYYRISHKSWHEGGPLRLPGEGSTLAPVAPAPSPPLIQEEPNTQITNPPEKAEAAQPTGPEKNRSTKTHLQKRAKKKSERDKETTTE